MSIICTIVVIAALFITVVNSKSNQNVAGTEQSQVVGH